MPNDAERNNRMLTIGCLTRSSTMQNTTSSASPNPMAPSTAGLVQPVVEFP